MPYFTWDKLKMPLNLDGSIGMVSSVGFTSALTLLTQANMDQLNGESPALEVTVVAAQDAYFIFLFPELRDLAAFLLRSATGAGGATAVSQFSTSTDTTNGLDGTWTTVTTAGTLAVTTNAVDWWRANAPGTFSGGAASGVRALRFRATNGVTTQAIRGVHIFGAKTSGQTVHDILFLNSDGTTVSTIDFDYGDVAAGGVISDTTIYVKNSSATLTANNIALSFTGSNPGDFLMSIDGGSNFFTTRTITSLAPAATQAIVVRLTTASVASGNATPRAANIRAAVGSWT